MGQSQDNWLSERDPRRAWRQYAAPIPDESLIETGFRLVTGFLRSISPYTLVLGYHWRKGRSDGYVLGWFGVLLLSAVALNFSVTAGAVIVVMAIVVIRLFDLYGYHLGVVMVDMRREKQERVRDHFALIERRIMFLLLDVSQAIICFGLLAQTLSIGWPKQFVFATNAGLHPLNTFDYIYMMAGQMLTVSSKFEPVTTGAEALHMLAVGGGVILVIMVLSYVISRVRPAV